MKLKRFNEERIANTEEEKKRLIAKGFEPMETEKKGVAEKKNLGEMKVDELKAFAKERGITGADALKKEELLEVLKEVE